MQVFWKVPLLSNAVFKLWKMDAQRKYEWVRHDIKLSDHLLEIGSGPGSVIDVFRSHGHRVMGLDIADNSFRNDLKADIYNGITMPYEDNSFDVALLLTMLHHTPNPKVILKEAKRVAKRLIIIEDVYDTPFQATYTKITDSITNMEFIGHPHTNQSDSKWLESFSELSLTITYRKIYKLAKFYQQAVYIVE